MLNRYSYYNKFKEFLLFVKVDENCNLRCSFCYQGDKKQRRIDTPEKIEKCIRNIKFGIDRFIKIKSEEEYEFSKMLICFFGGEPTLNLEAINLIVNRLKKIYTKDVLNTLYFTITTNGIIFNDKVIETLRSMKSLNDNYVSVMVSSDNEKEVYDRNRKLVGQNCSGYEIVQDHIKKYREALNEINGIVREDFVVISTVLATPEQLRTAPKLIQSRYKDIKRSGKLLYNLGDQSKDYIEESKKFLFDSYSKLIDDCTKENKYQSIENVMEAVWNLHSDDKFTECQSIYSINADGDVCWCNKHDDFDTEKFDQDTMRDISIFNPDIDNSHFTCVKDKLYGGSIVKDVIRPKLWEKQISIFDPNVQINNLNISDELKDRELLYNFIKYMMGSSPYKNKMIYINNPSDDIRQLLLDLNIEIVDKEIVFEDDNVFYVNKDGDLFFDKSLSHKNDYDLTNINQKHFMWIHTPTLLKSVNDFYSNLLN